MRKKYFLTFILILFTGIFYSGILSGEELDKFEVFYYPDSDEVKTDSINNMNEILKVLKENEGYIITLKGYTNSLGEPENELELSFRRSNRIALFLKDSGISLSRIKTEGYGSKNLKENKISEANRRVEVFVFKTESDTTDYKKDIRKIKITVLNMKKEKVYADIAIKKMNSKDTAETKYSIGGPRVIDVPITDQLEFTISSSNYETKKITVNKNEEEKIVYLDKMTESTGITSKEIEGFMMGSKWGEVDEAPVHKVKVNNFIVGQYEVLQKEWNDIMENNPSIFIGDNIPVHNVSWYDAIEYCNRKSIKEGLTPCYKIDKKNKDKNNKNFGIDMYRWIVDCDFSADGYRLPTEAEWEYSAKGGDKSKKYKYSGSNLINDVAMNISEVYINEILVANSGTNRSYNIAALPSGQTMPNELNLYDMSNNVLEWCWDWYDPGYYSKKINDNPKGPVSGTEKVVRGGINKFYRGDCRVSSREKSKPFSPFVIKREIVDSGSYYINHLRCNYIGFRVARTVK